MDLQLRDKVVLITGGAKGIGAAIARAVANESGIPVAVDKDGETGNKLRDELKSTGKACELICGDLCDAANCSRVVDEALKKFGRLDVLVNNAGVNDKVGLEHGTPQEYEASLRRNLLHYFNMSHYSLPALKKSQGCIVNI